MVWLVGGLLGGDGGWRVVVDGWEVTGSGGSICAGSRRLGKFFRLTFLLTNLVETTNNINKFSVASGFSLSFSEEGFGSLRKHSKRFLNIY